MITRLATTEDIDQLACDNWDVVNDLCVVCIVNNEIVGRVVGCLKPVPLTLMPNLEKFKNEFEQDYVGELVRFGVLSQYRNQGVGTQLLNTFVAEMRKIGRHKLYLWVLAKNTNARRMYEKNGWKPTEYRDGCLSYPGMAYSYP